MTIAENMLKAKKAIEALKSLRNCKKALITNQLDELKQISANIRDYSSFNEHLSGELLREEQAQELLENSVTNLEQDLLIESLAFVQTQKHYNSSIVSLTNQVSQAENNCKALQREYSEEQKVFGENLQQQQNTIKEYDQSVLELENFQKDLQQLLEERMRKNPRMRLIHSAQELRQAIK
ncbi:hypothetical protein FGO68_gene7252 [Halteria grandinella]|uniref:Uncharacterized protein n=1 Tax=Halteria grandinella TaxID=5974 RepID=A0A8J8T0T1_HALGN|nr:hypothetical protein FGO68_gene7252 [Halteria grandinella]